MRDYYAILGVTTGASEEDIKKAYRDKIRFYHPDAWFHNPSMRQKAEIYTRDINEAFAVLSNPAKRTKYDLEHHGILIRPEHAGFGISNSPAQQRNPHIWKVAEEEFRKTGEHWVHWQQIREVELDAAHDDEQIKEQEPNHHSRVKSTKSGRVAANSKQDTQSRLQRAIQQQQLIARFAPIVTVSVILIALLAGIIISAYFILLYQGSLTIPIELTPLLNP